MPAARPASFPLTRPLPLLPQDESKAEFAAFAAKDDGKQVKDFMGSMGLGSILDQLEVRSESAR